MLLMVEKSIRGGICHNIYQYAKANNKYIKHDRHKESFYFEYCNANNLYGSAVSQNLLANHFTWVADISEFNKDFIKSYYDESDEANFLEVDAHYPVNLHNLYNNLPFLPARMENLQQPCMIKKNTVF